MLKKSLDQKLFLLKLCLYLIIITICIVCGNKVFDTYKSISSITPDEISKWLNHTSGHNGLVSVKAIKLDWDKFNLYFIIDGVSFKETKKSVKPKTIVTLQSMAGRINILSTILCGKIKINSFVAKDINLTVNSIYQTEKIQEITGVIDLNVNQDKDQNKKLYLEAELIADNIEFNINTVLKIQPNNIKIIKFRLQNAANNVRDVIKYLPEQFINSKLLDWIDGALLSGSIKNSDLSLDENNSFIWKIKFTDLKLQYASGWPAIEKFSAVMEIIDDKLNIYMEPSAKGFILQQPIKQLSAKLIGMNLSEIPPLLVQAEIITPINKGVEFLKKTNLQSLGANLEKLSPHGSVNVSIKLLIPMNTANKIELIKFSGNCQLLDTKLKATGVDLDVTDLSGNIKFANNYLAADDLQAKIFGTTVQTKFMLDQDCLFIESPLFKTKILLSKNNQKSKIVNNNFDIIVDELFLFSSSFNKVRLINDSASNSLIFESSNAAGTLTYSDLKSGQYHINFDKLKINTKNSKSNYNNLQLFFSSINLIDFHCKNFYLNELYLGEISSKFTKDLTLPNKKLININQLYLKTKEVNVNAKGDWVIKDLHTSRTNISGKLNSVDFGNAFEKLNINSKFVKNGNGFIDFNLEWPNDPFGWSLKNILGTLKLDLKSGALIGVNPGLGRIIGLLSIENIQRRLHLDFSDVTGVGFSFDTLNGELNINQGEVGINNFIIHGPSAKIIITGNTSLISKQLDLSMEVNSKVGATLPIAAAIAAGNPVVGAALWLFDRASGAKVSEFNVQKYKITGTWEKPEINAI